MVGEKKTYGGVEDLQMIAAPSKKAAIDIKGFLHFIQGNGNSQKNTKDNICGYRSWMEINTENLKYNAKLLQCLMPKGCEMMAVVKANAYGHGAVKVSKVLNEIGVTSFAVATLDEGIELRKKGIKGEILILGYTDVVRAKEIQRYHLMQTVIDYDYAIMLSECNRNIEVHIKIDTGMHRLGVSADEIDKIYRIFLQKGIHVSGIYTHLSTSDSLDSMDVKYTWNQIESFYYMLRQLKKRKIDLPKIHIQSSYGLLNYNELQCNYARIGIALYGSLSSMGDKVKTPANLRPVLTLKSKIAMIREVYQGEGIGYGRDFHVTRDSKIAVIPIGYADGLPRNLTDGLGFVLVQGVRVPIIGKICMDQLLIDVTDLEEVKIGDIVTLIGSDGKQEIPAVQMAKSVGSITNELFSRLGSRIERIYI